MSAPGRPPTQVTLRSLPLELLGEGPAATTARREAGLGDEPPPTKPPTAADVAAIAAAHRNAPGEEGEGEGEGDAVDEGPSPHRGKTKPAPATGYEGLGHAAPSAIGAVHAKMCEYSLVGRCVLLVGS